jgi:serine/threonine-protein kinase
MEYTINDTIDGRYRVLDVIGQGAHGIVYRAEDLELNSPVAVKCLHHHVLAEPGFKTRMRREARALGALSGTSAVQILAMNRAREGPLYIVMELLEGQSFESYLRERETAGLLLPLSDVLESFDPIITTLEAAHGIGIIHRDLKPGNMFILDQAVRGRVRLLDFGMAKDMRADPLTQEGEITGSPSYIAPEVWRGRPQEVDHRIDVYSMGVILFRVLTGRLPFDTNSMVDLIIAVTRAERPSLHALRPDLPAALDDWTQKALAISVQDRFEDIRSLWNALQSALGKPHEY